jgi:hypothetical protein
VTLRIAFELTASALAGVSFPTFCVFIGVFIGVFSLTAGVDGGSIHPASLLVDSTEADVEVVDDGPWAVFSPGV